MNEVGSWYHVLFVVLLSLVADCYSVISLFRLGTTPQLCSLQD